MLPFAIDRHSVVPIYYQIQQHLLDRIHRGELKPGDPVPPEQELSASLGVSRMTVRQALKSLCSLGVAYSRRGRGTFISGMKLEKNCRQVRSFTEEMQALGLRPRSKVLSFRVRPAAREVSEALRLRPKEPVIRLERIRLAGASPMGVESSYLPQRLCPDLLSQFDPRGSLYQALWQHYGIQMLFADETVEAGLASAQDSQRLRVPVGAPVFLFTRLSYVHGGQPVEYVKSVYRGDRYKIVNRLTRLNRALLTGGSGLVT